MCLNKGNADFILSVLRFKGLVRYRQMPLPNQLLIKGL